jgi:hypothetical protein
MGYQIQTGTIPPPPPYELFSSPQLVEYMNHLRDIGIFRVWILYFVCLLLYYFLFYKMCINKADLIGFVPPLVTYNKDKNITNQIIIEAARQKMLSQQQVLVLFFHFS